MLKLETNEVARGGADCESFIEREVLYIVVLAIGYVVGGGQVDITWETRITHLYGRIRVVWSVFTEKCGLSASPIEPPSIFMHW